MKKKTVYISNIEEKYKYAINNRYFVWKSLQHIIYILYRNIYIIHQPLKSIHKI